MSEREQLAKAILRAERAEAEAKSLREALICLDRLGGLGYAAHERIRAELAKFPAGREG